MTDRVGERLNWEKGGNNWTKKGKWMKICSYRCCERKKGDKYFWKNCLKI